MNHRVAMILSNSFTNDPRVFKEAKALADNGYQVTVGSVAHPMIDEHHIERIELLADGVAYRKFLQSGDKPEASFCIEADKVSAREFCNLHGLWKGE